jgi:hypothetical protein
MLAAFLAAAIVFSGCTKDNVDTEQLKQLKPNDVVERVLAGLRTGETDSLVDYFAADVSRDIIKKRLADRAASVEIQTTRIDKPTEKKNTAIVRYVYVYTEKKTDKDGNKILGDKMREAGTAVLVKEDGIWKIRLLDAKLADRADKWVVQELGAKLDQDGEIALFKDCVLAVEITKLAEQMYAADNKGEYTNNAGLLSNYITDYDPEACATLKIHSIGVNEKGENDYRITAETKNMPVCSIWATKNKTYPDSWEKKCLGQKNPIAN